MAVGITILSGTRRGEELGLDLPEFRAGDDPGCELFFDPQREPGAAGREALFRLGDDGWYVKSVRGAALSVNQRPIEASTRLRSGDVVCFSPDGPEFAFKLLARLPAGVPKAPSGVATAALQGQSPAASPQAAQEAPFMRDWRLLASLLTGTLIGLAVLYLVLRQPGPSAVSAKPSVSAVTDVAPDATPAAPVADEQTTAIEDSQTPDAIDDDMNEADDTVSVAPAVVPAPKESPDEAVLLLLVEERKSASAWPFGSAAAIADHTLLTSATVATGLTGFRDKGWRLWAMNQRLGLKVEVTDLRVHAAFVSAHGQPEKQIYVDLGLLTASGSLPKRLSLATADELADLDRGTPVSLLGYLYENEPVDRFQTFLPEPHAGKIFVMTALPPSPGGPRLMHVRAELAGKMFGAPVLNQAGHIVGLFAETALPSPEQQGADLQIHYAPVADPGQIDRWLKDHDEQWWVSAESPKSKVRSPKSKVPGPKSKVR